MTEFRFTILHESPSCPARLGRVETPHGAFSTPVFMPVGTRAAVKALRPADVLASGAEIILANTYHLHLRPGEDLIARLGGLHRFMGWDGPILTDSGGYQVFSLSALRTLDEDGVTFRSHIDGARCFLGPVEAMAIQKALGSDIVMSFDECLPYPCDRAYAEASVDRTSRWEEITLRHHPGEGRALFGIVQGGVFPDLRRRSASHLLALPFDGMAMGGLFVGEDRAAAMEMLEIVGAMIPAAMPRYVMGVGSPVEVVDCVLRGWDMFDCVLPTRNARHGYAMTFDGVIKLKNARHREEAGPIDAGCDCLACATHSRAYLRHLLLAEESLAATLISHHNLRFMSRVVHELRAAIAADRAPSWREDFARRYAAGG